MVTMLGVNEYNSKKKNLLQGSDKRLKYSIKLKNPAQFPLNYGVNHCWETIKLKSLIINQI